MPLLTTTHTCLPNPRVQPYPPVVISMRSDGYVPLPPLLAIKYVQNSGKCSTSKFQSVYEPRHDKSEKMTVRPAKTQISLGIRPV